MRGLCIGDRIEEGVYRLHSRFDRVANFTDGSRLVSLVVPEVGAGPANIVIEPPLPAVVTWIAVVGRSLQSDAGPIDRSLSICFDSRLEGGAADPIRALRNLETLENVLLAQASSRSLAFALDPARRLRLRTGVEKETARRLELGVREFAVGSPLRGAEILKGCGWGLTPGGDDCIAGALAAWTVLRQAGAGPDAEAIDTVYRTARGDNLLSNAFLQWAAEGRGIERVGALVRAVGDGGEKAVRTAAARLCSLGESSGADWEVGFLIALRRGWKDYHRGLTSPAENLEAV